MPRPRMSAVRHAWWGDRHPRWGTLLVWVLLVVAASALLAAAVPLEHTGARAAQASARDGRLTSFSGGISLAQATLTAKRDRYAGDSKTFVANYVGRGAEGLARGSFRVSWKQGEQVAYGAAFLLPTGFHGATQGRQTLLRWDGSRVVQGGVVVDQGGVVIDYSHNLAYLIHSTIGHGAPEQQVIAGPFRLPIGRWFTLRVRQRLGSGRSAYSGVYVNGRRVAASGAPNFSGVRVSHVRYGIVELSPAARQGHVSMEFDRATASPYSSYVNPFADDHYRPGRVDMGVDLCLRPGEAIRAIGDGIVVGITRNWFEGEPYIWYRLSDGRYAGRYVYVAEQIRSLARVGSKLTAGQPVAYYSGSGTCIETGWSAPHGATLAQATAGYAEGQITGAGVSFAGFLISLGVHGPFKP